MIYPENFEEKLGFTKIRYLLHEACISELGKKKADEIKFSADFNTINMQLELVREFRQILNLEDDFPLGHFYDATPVLKKIKNPGAFFEIQEVFDLKKSLDNAKSILFFFEKKEETRYPNLKNLGKDIVVFPFLLKRIDQVINKKGEIRDNASADLAHIRKSIRQRYSEIDKRIQHIIKKAKQEGIVEEDSSITLREGRYVIPVSATHKRQIQGYIHDESATGKTVFIEPAEIVEINNEIKDLEYAERREIVKILTELADEVRPYAEDLLTIYDYLAEIDFIRAKAVFAMKINAIKPILSKEAVINLRNAVHPLLFLNFQKENKKVVPLNLYLNPKRRILVISGPNAGGKSVCLQTTGLIQYMMQCGLHIPVTENTEIGIFNKIFIDIGDEQSIENDLSTYSSHLINMKFFTKNADSRTLFLIDELGTGTEPMIGGAIAEAVLESLNALNAYGVVTTHYTNLKHFASQKEGIENGAMMFDTQHIQPLFHLQIGEPGSSFAFEIARKIGLSEDILQDATQKVGQRHIDYDKSLKEIIRDKHYWADKREKIRINEKKMAQQIEQYETELESIKTERKKILEEARLQAKNLLDTTNKTIENTINEIKKAQAEKDKTKEIRRNLDEFKSGINQIKPDQHDKIKQKSNELSSRKKQLQQKNIIKKPPVVKPVNSGPLKVGDPVKIKGQEAIGEIIEIKNEKATVAVGNLKTTLPIEKLEKTNKPEIQKSIKISNPFLHGVNSGLNEKKLSFKHQIDLRGKRVEEALKETEAFIDDAIMVGASEVKILHGKGDGILRQVVRNYLKTVDQIRSFTDEHVEMGGSGITVVDFK